MASKRSKSEREDYDYVIEQHGDAATAIFKSSGNRIGLIKTKTGWLIDNPAGMDKVKVTTETIAGDVPVHAIQGETATQQTTVTNEAQSTAKVKVSFHQQSM